jgi:teichuronic acid biosynthesis glycosyltransferase TuaH
MNIVIVAPQSWDFEIGSNAKNIAVEFAKRHKVIYVDPPLDIKSFLRKSRSANEKKELTVIQENLWNLSSIRLSLSINWINSKFIYSLLNRWNNERFASSIRKVLAALEITEFIVFNDNYMFNGLYLKQLLRPKHYVYYIRDYLNVQPYFKKHGTWVEPELMKTADAVVANSLYLQEYARAFNKNSFYVGQGCEVDMFDEGLVKDLPEDVKGVTYPIIGYVGFLTSMRLSIDLLIDIAQHNPAWNLVLVGPEDTDFQNSKLHQIKNVHFLGKREPAQLPAYVKAFDVCINPQVVNQLTIGNYPRKIDEYLAMGKPTVASATKAMEAFKECTYLAKDSEEFIKFIENGLAEKDPELKVKRKVLAQSHTWENSVKEIYNVIGKL